MTSLLNTSTQMTCPHGGTVSATSSNTSVKGGGDYVLRSSDTFTIAGCSVNISGSPHPCTSVQWVQPNARSTAAGDFTLSTQSTGLCIAADQAPQGTVLVSTTQSLVGGI
jgi:hypothetical protein